MTQKKKQVSCRLLLSEHVRQRQQERGVRKVDIENCLANSRPQNVGENRLQYANNSVVVVVAQSKPFQAGRTIITTWRVDGGTCGAKCEMDGVRFVKEKKEPKAEKPKGKTLPKHSKGTNVEKRSKEKTLLES